MVHSPYHAHEPISRGYVGQSAYLLLTKVMMQAPATVEDPAPRLPRLWGASPLIRIFPARRHFSLFRCKDLVPEQAQPCRRFT